MRARPSSSESAHPWASCTTTTSCQDRSARGGLTLAGIVTAEEPVAVVIEH